MSMKTPIPDNLAELEQWAAKHLATFPKAETLARRPKTVKGLTGLPVHEPK